MDNIAAQTIGGRYRLLDQLGQGGMGTVYRAYDRLAHQHIALKHVNAPPEKLRLNSVRSDPLLALAQEFRILASLRHPHIVAVLDYGFDAQHLPYYTMELLEAAQTITAYGRALDDAGKTRLLIETLQALVYLHRRGVIHCDLKPANVLVSQDGQVRVMDFGLALQPSTSSQQHANVFGTIAYMAPELFTEASVAPTSDLYAVGVLLYELFAGKHPYRSDNPAITLYNLMNRPIDLAVLPPQLVTLAASLLQKDPAARPQQAETVITDLCQAMALPYPGESLTVRESFLQASAFVGREPELATLTAALNETLQGASAFWLVGGESGVGKSRLIDELRTQALVNGALVLRGQGIAEGGLPYQVWREIIRRLVLDTVLTDFEAGVIKPFVSDLNALLGREIPDLPELTGAVGFQRLASTLVDILKRQPAPLVLLLEDLQWADESLSLLRHLLQTRDLLKYLLVIGTYRDDERPGLPQELDGMQVLKLRRLSAEAVAQLTRVMLGGAKEPQAVVELLHRETEGNIFFMVETLRVLAEEAGSLEAVGQATLPASVLAGGVQRIVQRRLGQLPARFRPLLKRVAVAGRLIDPPILYHLTTSEDASTFLAAGAEASLLEVVDGDWRFSHDKLREAVLAGLGADERRALHRVVAEALEASYPDNAAYDEVLLEHWQAAGDPERELHYLVRVVRLFVDIRSAYTQAEPLITRGLALAKTEEPQTITLLQLHSRLAATHGDLVTSEQSANQAKEMAERLGQPGEVATSLRFLGILAGMRGEFTTCQDYLEQSLAIDRQLGDQEGIAATVNGLGIVQMMRGDYPAAEAYYQQSLTINQAIDNRVNAAINLINLGDINTHLGHYAIAETYYQQSLTLNREIGNKDSIAFCLNGLGSVAVKSDNLETAKDYYQQALTIWHEIGGIEGKAISLNGLGTVASKQGDYLAAETYYQQALTLYREMDAKSDMVGILAELAALRYQQYQDWRPILRQALELGLEVDAYPALLHLLVTAARALARAGEMAAAARLAGLIETHPATQAEVRQQTLTVLKGELEKRLPAEALAAYLAEGAALDLVETARVQLARLETP